MRKTLIYITKSIKAIFKIFLVFLLIAEGLKLYFLIIANEENRLIQEIEIETGDNILYFNLMERDKLICNDELCEMKPDLKVVQIDDKFILRVGIDNWYSYFKKFIFDSDKNEIYDSTLINEKKFKNRTYQEQLISWHSIVIPFLDNKLKIIYFLDKDNPYIGIEESENIEARLPWDKLNDNNLADSFQKVNQEKLDEALRLYGVNKQIDAEEVNEIINSSYIEFICYEKKLQLFSIIFSVLKILVLLILVFYKKIKEIYRMKIKIN